VAKKRDIDLAFPLAGLNRKAAYQSQPPYTTPDCLNVRPVSSAEQRAQGGTRPGLGRVYRAVSGSSPIRMLAEIDLDYGIDADPLAKTVRWDDDFADSALQSQWTEYIAPPILDENIGCAGNSTTSSRGLFLEDLNPDPQQDLYWEILIRPSNGKHHGTYSLMLGMDDTLTYDSSGISVNITITGTNGSYTGNISEYSGGGFIGATSMSSGNIGTADSVWITAKLSYSDPTYTVTVFLNKQSIGSRALTTLTPGDRVGFRMAVKSGNDGPVLIDRARLRAYATSGYETERSRSRVLMMSAGGGVWRTNSIGELVEMVSAAAQRNFSSDRRMYAAQLGEMIAVSDSSEDVVRGTATVQINAGATHADLYFSTFSVGSYSDLDRYKHVITILQDEETGDWILPHGSLWISNDATSAYVRVEHPYGTDLWDTLGPYDNKVVSFVAYRGTKFFWLSYAAQASYFLARWVTNGFAPPRCHLAAIYRNRLVLANKTHYYMSRAGNIRDWDYAFDPDEWDQYSAVYGRMLAVSGGTMNDELMQLIPFSEDYLLFACRGSMWLLRGDINLSGEFRAVSRTVGIVSSDAWCLIPTGGAVFLDRTGLYVMETDSNGQWRVVPIGASNAPRELLHTDWSNVHAMLGFDDNGIHVWLSSATHNIKRHWWFDLANKAWWPVAIPSAWYPTVVGAATSPAALRQGMLLGCSDSAIRASGFEFQTDQADSNGAISSHVKLGPLALGQSSRDDGTLAEIEAVLSDYSGGVHWYLYTGDSAQQAVLATTAAETGIWSSGRNYVDRFRRRNVAATLKLANSSSAPWAMESVLAQRRTAGKHRKD
jgi:hypothetical protein